VLVLDAGGKFPNNALKTGSGQGLDADTVDSRGTTTTAGTGGHSGLLLALDGTGKFPNTALKTGSGQGLDADTVDGQHAAAIAAASHGSGYAINNQRLTNSSGGYTLPYGPFGGSIQTERYQFPTGKNIGIMAWYVARVQQGDFDPGVHAPISGYLQVDEYAPGGGGLVVYGVGVQQWSSDPAGNDVVTVSVALYGQFNLTSAGNYFFLYGYISCGGAILLSTRMQFQAWYL
jgi:hypothetical protein